MNWKKEIGLKKFSIQNTTQVAKSLESILEPRSQLRLIFSILEGDIGKEKPAKPSYRKKTFRAGRLSPKNKPRPGPGTSFAPQLVGERQRDIGSENTNCHRTFATGREMQGHVRQDQGDKVAANVGDRTMLRCPVEHCLKECHSMISLQSRSKSRKKQWEKKVAKGSAEEMVRSVEEEMKEEEKEILKSATDELDYQRYYQGWAKDLFAHSCWNNYTTVMSLFHHTDSHPHFIESLPTFVGGQR